jgi:hypothetical protein
MGMLAMLMAGCSKTVAHWNGGWQVGVLPEKIS